MNASFVTLLVSRSASAVLERDLEQVDVDTPGTQDDERGQFILGSRFCNTLSFIREMCNNTPPESLSVNLDFAIQEAQFLLQLQQHLGRIMQQIAHRYPGMNVLGLTDPRLGFQESILCGLQKAFRSYRIGQGIEVNLMKRMPNLNRNKVILEHLDL